MYEYEEHSMRKRRRFYTMNLIPVYSSVAGWDTRARWPIVTAASKAEADRYVLLLSPPLSEGHRLALPVLATTLALF